MAPNERLRARREATPSANAPGEPMSRAELAEAVNRHLWTTTGKRYGLDAHTIARYERGVVQWPGAAYRSGLRAVLGASNDSELGFRTAQRARPGRPPSPTARSNLAYGHRVDLDGSPVDFLNRAVVRSPVPVRIGWTDVEHIRATTRAVAMSENLFGGGLSCEAAAAQLRWASQLLEAQAAGEVRRALAEAIGNLASVVAFSAFDIAHHTAADRYFEFALWCAEEAGSWALRANTLAEMARKAAYLGQLDDALSLVEYAWVRSDRLTATARAMLLTVRARLLALADRRAEARADVDRADTHFDSHDPAVDPPWLCYYDTAEHQGSTGKALLPVAQALSQPDEAATRLSTAIRLQDARYPRSRAFSRVRLATLLMSVGDPHEAVPLGQQAVREATSLHSRRLAEELQRLAATATRHSQVSDVVDLRHEITRRYPNRATPT